MEKQKLKKNKLTLLSSALIFWCSITFGQLYTPTYVNTQYPDQDSDSVYDYNDEDDDNDGITDFTEGCLDFDIENTLGADGTDISTGATVVSLPDTDVTYTYSGGIDILDTDFLSLTHGVGIRARQDGSGVSEGDLTLEFSNPIEDLFFKLVDFDQNESWTVHVYDENNDPITLDTSNSTDGVYMIGQQVELLAGQVFHDNTSGVGGLDPNIDHTDHDELNAVYFYFPTKKVMRIEFHILHPEQGSLRFIGMKYCQQDTDGDGLNDDMDSDSDNDAIPDLVEAGGADTDGDGKIDGFTDADNDGLADIYDTYLSPWYFLTETGDCSGTTINYNHNINFTVSTFDTNDDVELTYCITGDYDKTGGSPSSRERFDLYIDDGAGGLTLVQDNIQPGGTAYVEQCGSITVAQADWNIANNDGLVEFTFIPNSNVDGDGGASDYSCLGDVDVYFNTTETAGSSIADLDSDSDTIKNRIDLDSDDDGITDNTEAQPTSSYLTLSNTDSDGDGIDNNYDVDLAFTAFPPEDSDSDGTPDFLDTDSDNTEENDRIEGHDTDGDGVADASSNADTGVYVGADADGDGIDDGYDNDDAGFDPTNASLQPTSHPIFDGGPDRDWRSTKSTIALDFDGVDDHVDFGDVADFEFNSSFSVEAWVLQESTATTGTIISKSNVKSGNEKGYKLVLNSGVPNIKWYDNSSALIVNLVSPYPAISNGRWYHIAATYDGTTAKLFIDGIEVASDTPISAPSYDTEKFLIGATYDSDTPAAPKDYFDGFIDEVRMWDVALSTNQIREMMNQEIQQSGTAVQGKVIPKDISGGLLWANLEAYYNMNDDNGNDASINARNGTPRNITTLQEQTAPLPYTTIRNGDWDDVTAATPWTLGDSVWDKPNGTGIDGSSIDWNIVSISHVVDADRDIKLLGLVSESTALITDEEITDSQLNIGAAGGSHELNISSYLKLDGKIDLQNESQLIQGEGSWLDEDSSGYVERDQQGKQNSFTYNYWSSPVSQRSVAANNIAFSVSDVLRDGTTASSPQSINFAYDYSHADGALGDPIKIATYWLWKFTQGRNDYSNWQWIGDSNTLEVTQGYSMKGSSGLSSLSDEQNYTFRGKPNNVANGSTDLVHTTFPGTFDGDGNPFITLTGNPFPSALDADSFIDDNINAGGTDAITGTLYFWEHWSDNTHVLKDYQGGYATYTKAGGVAATAHPDIDQGGLGTPGTGVVPGQYIPVGQGFFVTQQYEVDGMGGLINPSNGSVVFKNSQRVFQIENSNSESIFARSGQQSNNSENNNTSKRRSSEKNSVKQRIWLNVKNPEGYNRQLLASFIEGATDGIDRGYDAGVIDELPSDGFFIQEEKYFSIVAFGEFKVDRKIPIIVLIHEDFNTETVKIVLDKTENIEENQSIFILDSKTEEYIDLRSGEFEMKLDPGEYAERFYLVFEQEEIEVIEELEQEIIEELVKTPYDGEFLIYSNDSTNSIDIRKKEETEVLKVTMFNYLGQLLRSWETDLEGEELQLPLGNISKGSYILYVHSNNEVITKSVMVK